VRFDLEGAGPAVAHVDNAGVLARALNHASRTAQPDAARRQALQVHAAGFIAAMFAPHYGKDAKLRQRRGAPEFCDQQVVLIARNAVRFQQRRSNRDGGGDLRLDWLENGFFGHGSLCYRLSHGVRNEAEKRNANCNCRSAARTRNLNACRSEATLGTFGIFKRCDLLK
jgi:hypothetical protein